MSLRINGSVLGKRNVPTLSLATGMWNMRAQALYKRDNLWPIAFDSDAAAYFGAVATAGGTVSDAQRLSIDTFVRGEKIASRWDSIKRLYLPIWAAAAPNAICMKSLTSGTFNGTVTHAAGFIQSDGTTGYFDTGVLSADLGMSPSTAYFCAILKTASSQNSMQFMGARNSASQIAYIGTAVSGTVVTSGLMNNNAGQGFTDAIAQPIGILSASRSGGVHFLAKRITASRSILVTTTRADFGSNPSFVMYAMAMNILGSPTTPLTSQFGAFVYGVGLSDADDSALTLALKNLWEGTTGLTLP